MRVPREKVLARPQASGSRKGQLDCPGFTGRIGSSEYGR